MSSILQSRPAAPNERPPNTYPGGSATLKLAGDHTVRSVKQHGVHRSNSALIGYLALSAQGTPVHAALKLSRVCTVALWLDFCECELWRLGARRREDRFGLTLLLGWGISIA